MIRFNVTNTWTFSIKDFGIGIQKQDIPKLFMRFIRLKNAHILNTHGLGLGLALCKRIIDLYKGKIWVKSEGSNKGSTFFIKIAIDSPQIVKQEELNEIIDHS